MKCETTIQRDERDETENSEIKEEVNLDWSSC
jgi:hypothetical protein